METMTIDRQRAHRAVESTFFPVHKVYNRKAKTHEIIDGRNGQRISEVSEHYQLIPNEDVVKPFLNRFGAEAFKRVIKSGKNFAYEIETGREIEISKGDTIMQRLLIVNSYDKTKRYKFIEGGFRSYCFNGVYNGTARTNIQTKHIGEIDYKADVKRVLANFETENFETWRKMANIEVKEKAKVEVVKAFEAYEVEDEYSVNRFKNEKIQEIALKPETFRAPKELPTAWGLYNTLNWAIFHTVRTKNVLEYLKLNTRMEKHLMKSFSLN